jgi:hypothetical protein
VTVRRAEITVPESLTFWISAATVRERHAACDRRGNETIAANGPFSDFTLSRRGGIIRASDCALRRLVGVKHDRAVLANDWTTLPL